MLKFLKSEILIYVLVCVVVTLLVSAFYFKGLILDPANHATTFGGDGLTIHYNLQYHATYGTGTQLDAQYYPHGETIFLTAAQGFLAVTLAALRPVFPNIGDHAVTISNVLNYWSNILSALLLFLCLLKLKVRIQLALVFSILITFLAPQIYRQTCGHYSLSYSFLIPAVIYYLLDHTFSKSFILKSLVIGLLLICLGLNDPYLIAIGTSLILGSAGVALVFYRKWKQLDLKVIVSWALVALCSLAVTLIILSGLDSATDRTEVQYGFFDNISSVKGLLLGDNSWLSKLLTPALKMRATSFEAYNYLGIIPALSLIALVVGSVTKRRQFFTTLFENSQFRIIVIACFLVLLFSFSYPFAFFKEFTYNHLEKLLQFRAPGRFAWVFYYGMCLVTAKAIATCFDTLLRQNKKTLAALFIIPVLGIWAYDVHEFLDWRTTGNINHNALSPNRIKDFKDLTKELQLTKEHYHGLFLLPTEHGWTDKVHHSGSWRSNYEGYRLSVAAGLPLINGKLSRMSVSNNFASLQLVSDPLIKRSLLEKLDNSKSILILRANDEKLSPGEQAFLNEGVEIYKHKNFSLLKVDLTQLHTSLDRKRKVATSIADSTGLPIVYEHYEEDKFVSFAGSGSRKIDSGDQTVISIPIAGNAKELELSLWNYADIRRYGGVAFILQAKREGKVLKEMKRFTLDAYDTQEGWLKMTFPISIPEGTTELLLTSIAEFPYYIDELMLRQQEVSISYQENGKLYYNNILIEN